MFFLDSPGLRFEQLFQAPTMLKIYWQPYLDGKVTMDWSPRSSGAGKI